MTTPELDLVTKYGYERAEILNQASMADGLAEYEPFWAACCKT